MLDALAFAGMSLTLLGAPGPTNALFAAAGAAIGARALSLLAAQAAGYLIAVASLVLLVGPALAAAPGLVTALKIAAAAWLFWTGLALWRGGAPSARVDGLVRGRTMFVTTLLNPKGLVLAFGLMPSAAAGFTILIAHFAGLALLMTLTGCCWLAGGAALARAGAAPYAAKATALVLSGFGALLVVSAMSR